jgi:hypothetical protein
VPVHQKSPAPHQRDRALAESMARLICGFN